MLVRDSLRTEVAKQRALADDITDKQDQLRIDIDILNMMINRSEELMVQLRKRYEEEIQKRNDRYTQSPAVFCLLAFIGFIFVFTS